MAQALVVMLAIFFTSTAGAERGDAQRARFEAPLATLERIMLSGKSAEDVVDELASKNARIQTFQLEGLTKLYAPEYEKFEAHHDRMKELEDKLGFYVDLGNHIKFAESVNAPKKVVEHLKRVQAEGRAKFATYLKDGGWLGKGEDDPLPKLRRRVEKTDWMHYADDREYMQKQFNKHVKKILETRYDMRILNDPAKPGLHKFRRDVRWLLLWAQAVNGLMLLDPKDNPLPQYEHWLRDALAESPYVRLTPSKTEKRPVYLPKSLFIALTHLTEKLGDLKDIGEAEHEWLRTAIVESGYRKDPTATLATLLKRYAKFNPDYVGEATKLYTEYHDGPLLPSMRDAIKEREYGCRMLAI